jgi:hypothetical protein
LRLYLTLYRLDPLDPLPPYLLRHQEYLDIPVDQDLQADLEVQEDPDILSNLLGPLHQYLSLCLQDQFRLYNR